MAKLVAYDNQRTNQEKKEIFLKCPIWSELRESKSIAANWRDRTITSANMNTRVPVQRNLGRTYAITEMRPGVHYLENEAFLPVGSLK